MAVDSNTGRVFVTNDDDSAIYVIDGATGALIKRIVVFDTDRELARIAVDDVHNLIYVTAELGNSVTVIDGRTYAFTTLSLLPQVQPVDVAVNTTTGLAYVVNENCGQNGVCVGANGTVSVIRGR